MVVPAFLWLFLIFGFQEEKKSSRSEESIVVEVPNFYSDLLKFSDDFFDPKLLNLPPRGVKRKYFIKMMDELGELHETKEIYEAEFYNFANEILNYGVSENTRHSYYLNAGYQEFIRTLLRYKIIDQEALVYLGRSYLNRDLIESVYCLDNVIPKILTIEEWSRVAEFYNPGVNATSKYLRTLALIKKGEPVNDIRERFDIEIQQNESLLGEHFNHLAKAYVELIRNGAAFPEFAQKILFRSYLSSDPKLERGISKTYAIAGLPLPEKKIVQQVLLDRLKDAWVFEESVLQIVPELRTFEVELPCGLAKSYRDELLKNYQNLDDILYLVKCAGEDGDLAFWKKYADFNLRAYKNKEALIKRKDPGYHYHAAIEGYRRIAASGSQLSSATVQSLLKAEDDPLVHTRDLIVAYELAGYDPRCKTLVEKFESRIEFLSKRPAGAFFNEDSDIAWRKNEYHQRIVPFCEEIELAAYLNNPERTRRLSHKISFYALDKLKEEGRHLKEKRLNTSKSPVYAELAAILDLYESLKFTDGARSLAQHLHSIGFKLPARRAFRIGGFEKEAENQYFHWKDDAYWIQQEEEFNYGVRKKVLGK